MYCSFLRTIIGDEYFYSGIMATSIISFMLLTYFPDEHGFLSVGPLEKTTPEYVNHEIKMLQKVGYVSCSSLTGILGIRVRMPLYIARSNLSIVSNSICNLILMRTRYFCVLSSAEGKNTSQDVKRLYTKFFPLIRRRN